MFFNSIDFAVFLPIVFILYWFVTNKNLKLQNTLIMLASYVFYGWWDWRFLSLIIFSTIIDFSIGALLKRENSISKRKLLLFISVFINLGFLGFFKYFNFFVDNFITAFSFFGHNMNIRLLDIVLPVGISFYTFQTMSYTIDVYRRKIEPTNDFIAFSAFVAFFPQLVAGPIERASNLLPQFYTKRKFDYTSASDGMRQILWGLFKKVVIADGCAEYANIIFNDSVDMNGSSLALGAIFFAFQIYCDFSGYSDIAIGVSKLFGFKLMQNFAFPYFSRDVAEFWRRWHISLSTWFRDYLYIPLGGSRGGTFMKVRNTFIIFLVSGFWHGANWTFIFWGFLNALYFLPLLLTNNNRKHSTNVVAESAYFPSIKELLQIISTFIIVVFAWIFFRAENITHAVTYVLGIFSKSIMSMPNYVGFKSSLLIIALICVFIVIEWRGRKSQHALQNMWFEKKPILRYISYYVIVFAIIMFAGKEQEFIYFQF